MAENQENVLNVIENLALVTDAMQTMFPQGKIICVYELNVEDFKKVQQNFREIDHQHERFSIDMSGLEHVFILEKEEFTTETTTLVKFQESKITKLKKKRSSWFVGGRSSI